MTYLFPDSALLIFCKAPVPGFVKTRLIPSVTPEQAAAIHRQLAQACLRLATQQALCAVQLWCAPDSQHEFFTEAAQNYPISLHCQHGIDLGAKMHHALCSALNKHRQAIIIGCDCPSLTTADLRQALLVLQRGADVVLAPAEDGGYVLIGCTRSQAGLFTNMPWGTREVLKLTRERIRQQRLNCVELATHWDVDCIGDYLRYRSLLETDCRKLFP